MTVMSANGRLLASELTTVEGMPLGKGTTNAYLRMKAAAKAAGHDIWIAQPIGGYRSYEVQADMKVNPEKYGLSTVSTVNIASAGYSTHGLGNAIDIGSFGSAYGSSGFARAAWLIQHAPEFGFFREFGDKDPNHFHHDGFTAIDTISVAATGTLTPIEEDDMFTDADRAKVDWIYQQMTPGNAGGKVAGPGFALLLNAANAAAQAADSARSAATTAAGAARIAADAVTPGQEGVKPAGATYAGVQAVSGQIGGLTAAVAALGQGGGVDPAELDGLITSAVDDAVKASAPTLASAVIAAVQAGDAQVLDALKQLPDEVRATLKAAL